MLARNHAIPLYYQLKTHLEDEIKGYQAGDRLPSEQELAEQFGVSRPTVRQALAELVSEGKLEKRRGLGTYVLRPKLDNALTSIISLAQQLNQTGLDYATRLLIRDVRQVDEELAEHLGVDTGTAIIYIERLRILEGEPFYISQDFLLRDMCGSLLTADLLTRSLFDCVESDCGVKTASVRRYLEAAAAEESQAELLEISPGAPIHYLQTYAYDQDGHLWGYFRDFFRADRSRFAFTVTSAGLAEAMQTIRDRMLSPSGRTH